MTTISDRIRAQDEPNDIRVQAQEIMQMTSSSSERYQAALDRRFEDLQQCCHKVREIGRLTIAH